MSAVISEQSSNNVAEFLSPGPGERLRSARLSKGFDIVRMASELHLTSPVVEALEADDYENVGARVFVRGYLRNYARIVDVPVDSILRQFDEKWPDEAVRSAMVRPAPKLPADGGPSRGWAGAVSWLLVVGTLVLFLMWWRGYLDGIVPGTAQDAAPTAEERVDDVAADGALALTPLDDAPLAAEDGSLALPALPAEYGAPEPQSAATTDVDVPPAVTAQATGGSLMPTLPATTDTTSPLAGAGGIAADTPDAAAVGELAAPAPPEVVMNFRSACWVDVRDSERKFKLFGTMPKGTSEVLGGTPPYKLIIGNARAVEITIDGVPFDLTPYAKGNVARFTLEP